MKKLICIFTVLALFVTMWTPAFAADKIEAITVRLARTEGGGVSVTTNTDKAIKTTEDMRLFNGYKVGTDKKSFAYLSLDDSKAIKMDKNSKIELKKEGNKNEVILSTGKIFFDVNKKLEGAESMQIETTNVSMGIRGTSGVVITVYVFDDNGNIIESHTIIQLYDGETMLEIRNPQGGTLEHLLEAGTWVDITENMKSGEGNVEFKTLEAKDIPSFVVNEILKNEGLIGRFEDGTKIPKEELIEAGKENAEAEKKEQDKREDDIAKAEDVADSESNIVQAPDVADTEAAGGGGGSTTLPNTVLTGALTDTDLTTALAAGNVTLAPGSSTTLNNNINIPAGRDLTNQGSFNLNGNELSVSGTTTNTGTLNGGGVGGAIVNTSKNSFYNSGTISGVSIDNINGKFVNEASGIVTDDVTLLCEGDFIVINNGEFQGATGGVLFNSDVLNSKGTINNTGTLPEINVQGQDSSAEVTNSGTIGTVSQGTRTSIKVTNNGTIGILDVGGDAIVMEESDGAVAVVNNNNNIGELEMGLHSSLTLNSANPIEIKPRADMSAPPIIKPTATITFSGNVCPFKVEDGDRVGLYQNSLNEIVEPQVGESYKYSNDKGWINTKIIEVGTLAELRTVFDADLSGALIYRGNGEVLTSPLTTPRNLEFTILATTSNGKVTFSGTEALTISQRGRLLIGTDDCPTKVEMTGGSKIINTGSEVTVNEGSSINSIVNGDSGGRINNLGYTGTIENENESESVITPITLSNQGTVGTVLGQVGSNLSLEKLGIIENLNFYIEDTEEPETYNLMSIAEVEEVLKVAPSAKITFEWMELTPKGETEKIFAWAYEMVI